MSEEQPGSEQQQQSEPAPSEQQAGNRWGDPISPERAAELRELADRQRAWVASAPDGQRDLNQSVFKNAGRLTGANVFWLATYVLAEQYGNFDVAEAQLRAFDDMNVRLSLSLSSLHLEGADLREAHLEGADLDGAYLERAHLYRAHLEGAYLRGAHLEGADLDGATLDKTSHLNDAVLTGVSLDQVTFDNVNLTVVDWSRAPVLGDELTARNPKDVYYGKPKNAATRRFEYAAAVRANRVLATTLRSQGMNEDADRYAYRAQLLQRVLLRRQRKWGRWLGTGLLDAISGYSYKPMRSVFTYVLVVLAFAGAYLLNAQFASPHLRWDEALVLSISAFHGRGFFTSSISLGDTLARIAAGEAIIGLLIEITFIATFTQRFFAR